LVIMIIPLCEIIQTLRKYLIRYPSFPMPLVLFIPHHSHHKLFKMKILFLFLLSILIAGTTTAQTLTADEMISKTSCTSFDCFNEFVTNKGFSFNKYVDAESGNMYMFFSDRKFLDVSGTVRTNNSAIINFQKNNKYINLGFRTANKNQYIKLLLGFQIKGFREENTVQTDSSRVIVNYTSAKFPDISLTIFYDRAKKGELEWTSYNFDVLRKRK
jgi:hypothetical protein